jgi:hypothetical protein
MIPRIIPHDDELWFAELACALALARLQNRPGFPANTTCFQQHAGDGDRAKAVLLTERLQCSSQHYLNRRCRPT